MALLDRFIALHTSCKGTAPTSQEQITYIYSILGVLDSKASALMRFDAIMIAGASLLLQQKSQLAGLQSNLSQFALAAILLFSLGAAGSCLWVVQVSYDFLGKIVVGKDENGNEQVNCGPELTALGGAARRRTIAYRIAWWLSVIAVMIFLYVGLKLALA